MTDHEDLRLYLAGSQEAFARLVARHLNVVYSVALRQVRSTHLAEDVAQTVFLELSRRARSIPAHVPLIAWLHVVTRRIASNLVRAEARRAQRERLAMSLPDNPRATPPPAPEWLAVEPLLDQAVEALPPADRTAILLRFFGGKSLREVGLALGASEDAAQKRVARALEVMRTYLLQRGIATGTATLAAGMSAHAVQLAPAALASTITSTAAAAGLAAAPLMLVSTLNKTFGVIALLAAGTALYYGNTVRLQRPALADATSRHAALVRERDRLRDERSAALNRPPAPADAPSTARPGPSVTPDPAIEQEIRSWFARIARIRQLAYERPDLTIPEMRLLTDDDWHSVADGDAGQLEPEKLLGRLRMRAKNTFGNHLRTALNDFAAARAGEFPRSLADLQPFLPEGTDPAMLQRYAVVRPLLSDSRSSLSPSVIVERPSDLDDTHLAISRQGFSFGPFNLRDHAARAARDYAAANPGAPVATGAALLPYFDPPLPPGLQQRFLQAPEKFLQKK